MSRLWFVLPICLSLSLLTPSVHGSSGTSTSFYDPLLFAHLILRGTVESTNYETITMGDGGGVPPELNDQPMTIMNLEFRIGAVLKGSYLGDRISIPLLLKPELTGALRASGEWILCLQFHNSFRGGSYFLRDADGAFTVSGDEWVRGQDAHSFTFDEIGMRIEEGEIDHVIEGADVIAIGTIQSAGTVTLPQNPRLKLMEYTLQVETLLKGQIKGSTLKFVTYNKLPVPSWLKYSPARIQMNERWYVFLKKGEVGYYPFAGANGMLRISADKLIYDNKVEYRHKKSYVDKAVSRMMSDAQ